MVVSHRQFYRRTSRIPTTTGIEGSPEDSEAAADVLADVLDGYVTPESARERYGVVIDEEAEAVDGERTEQRRS